MLEEMKTRTYEELLMNRIAKAFEAMDSNNTELFDEILEEIEMLFKLQDDMYELLMEWKQYHIQISQESYKMLNKKISLIEDDYIHNITRKKGENEIEWGYRKDMLESALNIMKHFQKIPFSIPVYAEMETAEKYVPQQEEISQEVPQQEQEVVEERQPLVPNAGQNKQTRQPEGPPQLNSPSISNPHQQLQNVEMNKELERARQEAEDIQKEADKQAKH